MNASLFKYQTPLIPGSDRLVCVFREDEVNQILTEISIGEYLAILGPGKVGKTTLLHLIRERKPEAYYIHFSIEEAIHLSEIDFYKDLLNKLLPAVPSTGDLEIPEKDWKEMGPSFVFLDFLRRTSPKDPSKKIIFLLDDVDKLPYRQSFLSMWRQVYHERYDIHHFNCYSIVITGGIDLVTLTSKDPRSPFNIAETLYIRDFASDQCKRLFQDTFNKRDIVIDENALERLIEWLGGHPQLIQHAGSILVNRALNSKVIRDEDIDAALDEINKHNICLITLRSDIATNKKLRDLLQSMLIEGRKRKFFRFKETALYGAGAVVEHDSYCQIRNKMYEKVIREILESQSDEQDITAINREQENV